MNRHLLVVDPQNDFCDSRGTLFVPGADADIKRLSDMLRDHRDKVSCVHVTLDSHHWFHIAHPMFWLNEHGAKPANFTTISLDDVTSDNPTYKARDESFRDYAINYVKALKDNDRYELTIWPPHCIIGSWGHCIFPPLVDAICFLEEKFIKVQYHIKGENPLTEHYSAIRADVVDKKDPSTSINQKLLDSLASADEVLIAGQARTHCVAYTVRDIINNLGPDFAKKCILLEDAMSDIKGYEAYSEQFLSDMKSLGMRLATTETCFT